MLSGLTAFEAVFRRGQIVSISVRASVLSGPWLRLEVDQRYFESQSLLELRCFPDFESMATGFYKLH